MSVEPNTINSIETQDENNQAVAQVQPDQSNAMAKSEPVTAQSESPIKAFFRKRKEKKKEKKKKTVGQEIMSWVWTILAALAIATIVRAFIAEPVRVDGSSMTNTLKDGEIVLVSKMAYGKGTEGMERGDIVICRYPKRTKGSFHLGAGLSLDSYEIFVKRLVGLPGDTVEIKGGKLFVNGKMVPDPEKMNKNPMHPIYDFGPIPLKTDQYFVIGDYRGNSHDSRAGDVGPISRDMIMGKAVCVLFPFNAIRGIE